MNTQHSTQARYRCPTLLTDRLSADQIELYGRQAKHHLAAAQRHSEKATDHRKSAAWFLIAAKKELKHGEYGRWLAANGIAARTAQLLVQEYADPESEQRRRARYQ